MLRPLILACCLTTLTAADWQATMATLWGDGADQAFPAAVVGDDGVAIVGGNGIVAVPGVPVHAIGQGGGVLLRIDTVLGEVLSVTTLDSEVQALALDDGGAVFVSAGTVYKLDSRCREVLWQGGSGGKRLCHDGAGGVWSFHGKSAEHLDAAGKQVASVSVGGKDFAVDPLGKRLFTCGFSAGRSKKSGNPVHVPWVRAFDWEGRELWKMWGFTPTECDEVGDMADSHPQRLCFGPDGYLYMFGDSDGGNTVYRHSPHTPGGSLNGATSGTAFNEMWKAFRSVRMLFVCRIDPANGDIKRGTFFYGKWFNPEANREEIGDGQALALNVDKNGRVLIGGVMRCKLPWTPSAVHKQAAPMDKTGYWKNIVATDEAYLAILDQDFTRLGFCSGFNQGETGNYASQTLCVAAGGDGAVAVGWMKKPDSGAEPASDTCFLRGAVQSAYGGGKDAYVITLSAKRPPTDPIALVRTLCVRLYEGETDPLLAEVIAAAGYGELIARLQDDTGVMAQRIHGMLLRVGAQTLQRADSFRSDEPVIARDQYEQLVAAWSGTAVAAEAQERLEALKKDRDFQDLVKINEVKLAVLDLQRELVAVEKAEEETLLDSEYVRKNSSVLRKMQRGATAMYQRWPEHRYTREVLAVCESYGVPVTEEDEQLLQRLGAVMTARKALRGVRGAEPLWSDASFRSKNQAALDQIRANWKAMRKAREHHPFTSRAEAIAGELGIPEK